MSRDELIVFDPDCIALAFAAIVWLMVFCWAIVFVEVDTGRRRRPVVISERMRGGIGAGTKCAPPGW